MGSYLIPFSYGEDTFIEKKSKFIGRIWPISSEEDALIHIKKTRSQHSDATHNVYAYVIKKGNVMRCSDDGEPRGTAGVPVLEVLKKENVTHVCCVVTRYFGGILLGAGGLIRAYSKGAKIALSAAGIARMSEFCKAVISIPYNLQGIIQNILLIHDCIVDNIEYGENVIIYVTIEHGCEHLLNLDIMEASSGRAQVKILDTHFMANKIK